MRMVLRLAGSKAAGALLALALLVASAPAGAIPLSGLLAGGSFDSGNGQLTFDNFAADAEIDGLPFGEEFLEDVILGLSHVFPLADGFAIFSPVIAIGIFHHVEVSLDLSFDVWAADGLEIVGASIAFLGFELGDAEASATSSFFDGGLLETLMLGAGFFSSDSVAFSEGHEHLSVADVLAAEACGCGVAKAVKLIHHFETARVPEPASVWLLAASGLTGLWVAGRRRAQA